MGDSDVRMLSETVAPKTCGQCRHYHLLPRPRMVNGATDMSQPQQGECREGPPHLTIHLHQGQQLMLAGYPQLPVEFVACDRFE